MLATFNEQQKKAYAALVYVFADDEEDNYEDLADFVLTQWEFNKDNRYNLNKCAKWLNGEI